MFAQPTCSSCGAAVERSARFCPHCGQPRQGAQRACGQCNRSFDASARFCPHCGAPANQSAAPDVRRNRWQRNAGEIAVRLEARDLKGWLFKDLIVEPGEQALLIFDGRTAANQRADGRLSEVVGPGSYVIQDLGDRLATAVGLRNVDRASVILMEAAPFDIEFELEGMFTQDPLRVALSARASVQIRDPHKFYTGLLRTRMRLTAADLADHLRDEAFVVANEWIGRQRMQELAVGPDARDLLEIALLSGLDRSLEDIGVEFRHVRTFNYICPVRDQELRAREEYLIRRTELDTRLQEEQLLADLKNTEELHKLAEETRAVEQHERRAVVRQRMRRAVMSDKFAELRDQREMEEFLRGIDREKLLSDEEWDRFRRTIQWRRDDELRDREDRLRDRDWARQIALEDRGRDRAHLLARIELENRYDLQRLQAEQEFAQAQAELARRVELEPAQLAHELEQARRKLEGALELARTQLQREQALASLRQEFELTQARQQQEAELAAQERAAAARRKQLIEDERQHVAIAISQATTAAEIARLEREEDRLDIELGQWALREMKAIRREDELAREQNRLAIKAREMQIDLEVEERRERLAREREQALAAIRLQEQEQENRFRLDWIQGLRGMAPAELAVAAPDAERAAIVRDMQETEAMKGMSERQILAMMSRNAPQAAQALAEIARAAEEGRMGDAQRALYERLLEQQGALADFRREEIERLEQRRQDDLSDREKEREAIRRMQETTLGGIAGIEAARGPQPPQGPPTVIIAGGGGATTIAGSGGAAGQRGAAALRCPKCGEVVEETANFCPNCQHRLRGS